jgi:hypothetical protein
MLKNESNNDMRLKFARFAYRYRDWAKKIKDENPSVKLISNDKLKNIDIKYLNDMMLKIWDEKELLRNKYLFYENNEVDQVRYAIDYEKKIVPLIYEILKPKEKTKISSVKKPKKANENLIEKNKLYQDVQEFDYDKYKQMIPTLQLYMDDITNDENYYTLKDIIKTSEEVKKRQAKILNSPFYDKKYDSIMKDSKFFIQYDQLLLEIMDLKNNQDKEARLRESEHLKELTKTDIGSKQPLKEIKSKELY